MAGNPKLFNLARMTSATTGTGDLTLGTAVSGCLTFAQAGVSNGDLVRYAISDGTNAEIGTATYSSTGPALTGRTPIASTNSNAAIACSGAQEVFITPAAKDWGGPVGHVIAHAATTAPPGFLECDGSAVSRTTYKDLFDVIGTTWGAGNGSTTFNLPNFRGEFLRGYDNGRGVDSGRVFAADQLDALQGHTHNTKTSVSGTLGSGTQIPNSSGTDYGNGGAIVTDGTNGTPRTASETRPRNQTVLYCIKY